MQNRYFGDVGDFGKYGLLRILSGLGTHPILKLGVVWYLFPDEAHNADGKHIGYLQNCDPAFRDCDEELYDKLRASLFDDLGIIEHHRHTDLAESAGLLPQGAVFYSTPLSYSKELSSSARLSLRKEWFAGALAKTACADLVFLDPDNGIECVSVKRTGNKGPKYAFWEDMDAFIGRGQSIVVYHHLNRTGSHLEQVERKLRQMNERYGNGFESAVVIFKRGTNRAYFVLAAPQHTEILRERLHRLAVSPWSRHFVAYESKVEER